MENLRQGKDEAVSLPAFNSTLDELVGSAEALKSALDEIILAIKHFQRAQDQVEVALASRRATARREMN